VDNLGRGRLVMASNELGNKRPIMSEARTRRSFSSGSKIAITARVVPEVLQVTELFGRKSSDVSVR